MAIFNASASYSAHPSFSVWDVNTRQCQFKVGGEDFPYILGGAPPMWGKDDEWVGIGPALPNETFACLDPETGKIVREIPEIIGDTSINSSGTKIVYNNNGPRRDVPHINIFDLRDGSTHPVGMVDCGKHFELRSSNLSWDKNDNLIVIGHGWLSTSDICSSNDIEKSLIAEQHILEHYFIARVNPNDFVDRTVLNFDYPLSVGASTTVNYKSNAVYLPGTGVLNADNLTIIPLIAGKAYILETGSTFSPDGEYIYLATTRKSGSKTSYIFDSKSGQIVGSFPAAKYQAAASISPDGRLMAFARDLEIEVYSLS